MKTRSTNPRMAMMMGRAKKRPALAVNPEVAAQATNPMAAMATPTIPTMKKGGTTMKSDMKEDTKMDVAQDKAMIKKAFKQHDVQEHKGGKGTKLSLKKGGAAEVMGPRTMSQDVEKGSNKLTKFGESAVQKRGHTKGRNLGDSGKTLAPKQMCKGGMAKGGSASSRADGIAQKGKTKGKWC